MADFIPSRMVRQIIEFLSWFDHTGSMIHNIEEEYCEIYSAKGETRANIWFWKQMVISIPRYIKLTVYWGGVMFINYLKIALRNLRKHKGYSFINITGLAVGIACSLLIFIFVNYEFSYDKFHKNGDRIYRYASRIKIGDVKIDHAYSSAATFKKALEDFPEIETGVKILQVGTIPISFESKTFNETRILAVDSTFFDVFNFKLIYGYPKTVLTEPNTIVISEETALKYFGKIDVVGQQLNLKINSDEPPVAFQITGVTETVPFNSHFHYDFLVSSSTFPDIVNNTIWDANNFISYYLLKAGVSHEAINDKLKEFTRKYLMGEDKYDQWIAQGNYWDNFLQPLTSIHLNSNMRGEFEANGDRNYVYMFLIISIIILIIACINFMNLSTAKSSLRAKEVALRKVVGSDKKKLIFQFLSESIILSFISMAIGILIIELLLPGYRNIIGKPVKIDYFNNPVVIPAIFTLVIFIGVLSGAYPAFVISSFKPVSIMKSKIGNSKQGATLRNALILTQFSISIFLIIGTIVVNQQLSHMQNIKLGFNKEHVLVVRNTNNLGKSINAFKERLKSINGISYVSGSSILLGGFGNTGFREVDGDKKINLNIGICDYNYLNALGLELSNGRFFSQNYITDTSAVILNQKAVEQLGWDDPIGKRISHPYFDRSPFTIVGVVKDYYYESLHQEVKPMALFLNNGAMNWFEEDYAIIRFNNENPKQIISSVGNAWSNIASGISLEYSFLDEDYNNLYIKEQLISKLFTIFSLLAISIACLGLYGLASFIAERKSKEIGIRKVLGASTQNLFINLVKQFTKWVLVANIIAWPIAYLLMNNWLQNFAYRINLSPWTFIFAGFIALAIAVLTVSYQSIKVSISNPIDVLKYE